MRDITNSSCVGFIGMLFATTLILFLIYGCTLSPTTQAGIMAACKVDAIVQPVLVALSPLAGAQVQALATADQQLAHPVVQAACAAVGGVAVGVKSAG